MKYRKYMEELKVSEWDSQYLNYKEGKKNIKLFCSSIPKPERNVDKKPHLSSLLKSQTRAGFSKVPEAQQEVHTTTTQGPSSEDEEDVGLGNLKRTVTNNFNPGPLLKRLTGSPIKARYNYQNSAQVQATAQGKFTNWLMSELAKIEGFYKIKEDEALKRFLALEEQLTIMQKRQSGKAYSIGIGSIEFSLRKRSPSGSEDESMYSMRPLETGGGRADYERADERHRRPINKPTEQAVRSRLKYACIEYYRRLEFLRSYVVVNREAFRKITKKFDKVSGLQMSNMFMHKNITRSYFAGMDNKLDRLLNDTELLVAKCFYGSDRKLASTRLRTRGHKSLYHGAFLRSGVYLGAASVIGIYAVWEAIVRIETGDDDDWIEKTEYVMQIWAGIALILLQALLFAINLRVWAQNRINYAFIFEFDPRHNLNHRQFLEIPAFLTLAFILCFWLSIHDFWRNKLDMIHFPIIYLAFVGFLIFNPLKTYYGKARLYFINTLWRVIMSGLYHVYFKDVWLGDMMTSQAYAFSKTYLFFCLYSISWKNPGTCSGSDKQLWGLIGAIPAFFRLVQCIRRYYDSGQWFPHLANAAKYSIGVAYYITLNLWRVDKENMLHRNIFMGVAIVASCINIFWDAVLDWSLMNPQAPYRFLRNDLFFKSPIGYYLALILNPILRFSWVLYIVFANHHKYEVLLGFGIAVGEVFRRFIWCFLRMENEHRGHVENNCAYKDPKLPYQFSKDDEMKMSLITSPHEESAEPLLPSPHEHEQAHAHQHLEPMHVDEETAALGSTKTSINYMGRKQSTMQRLGRALSTAHRKDYERESDRRQSMFEDPDEEIIITESDEEED